MRKSALSAILMLAGAPVYAQTAQPVFSGAQMAGSATAGAGGQTVYVPWIACTDASNIRISCGSTGAATSGNTVDVQGTGSLALATANATYSIALSGGRNTVGFTITGLTGSGATLTAERSNDGGTTWSNANTTESSATSSLSPTLTADGQARVGVAGATNLRLRVSTAGTGTATIAYNATTAAGPIFLTSLLPTTANPGTNVIGGINNQMVAGVTIATGTGASNTGTQRVVLSSDSTIGNTAFALNAGTNSIGTVGLNAGTNAIGSITNTTFASTVAAGANVAEGAPADAAYAGSGSASLVAAMKGVYAQLASIFGNQTNGTQTLLNQQSFLESTANLAASASFVGTVRTAPAWANTFVARAVSNVPGTIRVGVSLDGTTSNSVAAGIVPLTLQYDGNYAGYVTLPISAPAANLRPFAIFVNGSGSATNSLTITSAFSAVAVPNGDTAGTAVVTKGSGTIATGQVSVGTSATLIRASDPGRTSITVIVGAANGCAFGNAGVTTTTGYLLPATAGATDTTATSAALYGVCSAATTISYKVILP